MADRLVVALGGNAIAGERGAGRAAIGGVRATRNEGLFFGIVITSP